jgi:hypothetical protein
VWSIVSFLFGLGFFLRGLFFIFFRDFFSERSGKNDKYGKSS